MEESYSNILIMEVKFCIIGCPISALDFDLKKNYKERFEHFSNDFGWWASFGFLLLKHKILRNSMNNRTPPIDSNRQKNADYSGCNFSNVAVLWITKSNNKLGSYVYFLICKKKHGNRETKTRILPKIITTAHFLNWRLLLTLNRKVRKNSKGSYKTHNSQILRNNKDRWRFQDLAPSFDPILSYRA